MTTSIVTCTDGGLVSSTNISKEIVLYVIVLYVKAPVSSIQGVVSST